MEVVEQTNHVSPRIQQQFDVAATVFLDAAHESTVAHAVVARLRASESDQRYATGGRNASVKRLATDVETDLGVRANLMFRSTGALHDALQALMDAYEDAMDGIYYHKE